MTPQVSGIYKIVVTIPAAEGGGNHTSSLTYIGKSKDIVQRYHQHQHSLRVGNHANPIMQELYNQYGPDSFEMTLIEVVDDVNKLESREVYWIHALSPQINIMNTKLSPADIRDIKYALSLGEPLEEVAHRYDISFKYLREILRGGRWGKIT